MAPDVTSHSTSLPTDGKVLRPQAGPQEQFLSSPADFVIYGGQAGGGKTFALLLEGARHVGVQGFNAVCFRRTSPQIRFPGGMWDESKRIYTQLGGERRDGFLEWRFPNAVIKFAGLQYEDDVEDWKGAQVCLLEFDQIEEFTERQVFYLLSRNRSTCGVRPYARGTCNPDPDSWIALFIAWWIDPDTGYPIPERAGVIRWFVRIGDVIEWADSPELLRGRHPEIPPKSCTFIPASIRDNPALMKADPGYLANLMALPPVDRERLLGGNWKVRPSAGHVFNRAWCDIVDAAPMYATRIRYWDNAGTEEGGAYSCGVRMALAKGVIYVEDSQRGQWSPTHRETVKHQVAQADGTEVAIWNEQEPGSSGKESVQATIRSLIGYKVYADRVTGDKLERFLPLCSQAQAGNVKLVRGAWNEDFLRELHAVPEGKYRDQADAAAGAFNKLTAVPEIPEIGSDFINDFHRESPWKGKF